jgi:hypothetical protein
MNLIKSSLLHHLQTKELLKKYVLTEEKLDEIGAKLEHMAYKFQPI